MPTPLTIAIPTFNRGRQVRSLCEAIVAQMEPADELVVSDDGSTDGTAEALGGLPRATVLRRSVGLGMVGNWNFCLTAGTRDWVCLIHDDDRLRPGGLSAVRRTAAAAEPGLIAHAEWEPPEVFFDDALWVVARAAGASACLRAEFCPSGVTTHRAVVAAVGGFDAAFAYSADMEFFARVCARFPSYLIRNPGVIEYVKHGENYQLKTWRKPDFLDQLRAVEAAAVGHAGLPPDVARKELDRRLVRDLRHILLTMHAAGERGQVGPISLALRPLPGLGRRLDLASRMGARFGWFPPLLLG